MSNRGEPKITPTSSQPAQEFTITGGILTLLLLFGVLPVLFWIVTLIWGAISSLFSSPAPAPAVAAPIAVPQTATANSSSTNYYRVLSSGRGDIAVVLATGNYTISVNVDPDSQVVEALPETATFVANLYSGVTKGNLASAKNIVIYGNANLKIADIGELDQFIADIKDQGPRVSAYFDYSRSARGPPQTSAVVHRKVFLVGSLKEIDLPDSHGQSKSVIRVAALGPKYWSQQEERQAQSSQQPATSQTRPLAEERARTHPSTTHSRGR